MQSLNASAYTSPNHHGSAGQANSVPGFLSQQQQLQNSVTSNGVIGATAFNAVSSSGTSATSVGAAASVGSRSNSNTRASSPTTSLDMHDSSMDEGMNSSSSVVAMNEVRDKLKGDKRDKQNTKRLIKEMAPCKTMMQEMEVSGPGQDECQTLGLRLDFNCGHLCFVQVHEEAWPFLLPVNTKQFPTYKKIIKAPMDLSTIQKRVHDLR